MIEVHDWIIDSSSNIELSTIKKKYATTFTSAHNFDERSGWAVDYLNSVSSNVVKVLYRAEEVALELNDVVYDIGELKNYSFLSNGVLIDATSLELPELVHLFKLCDGQKINFDVLYVQPATYNQKDNDELDKQSSFDLSDDGLGIQQVPPYVGLTELSSTCIFLGFEGHRIGSLIHSDEFRPRSPVCLIGTPAFKLGWENHSLSSNFRQLIELDNDKRTQFRFVGANDPLKTYETLKLLYDHLSYERKSLCLVPFGTKPGAIAAAQLAVNFSGVILTYDFVRKKPRRSKGVGKIHTFSFRHTGKV